MSWAIFICRIFPRRRWANLEQIIAANGLRPQPVNAAVGLSLIQTNLIYLLSGISMKTKELLKFLSIKNTLSVT